MERPCLNDPNEFPDDVLLARQLGQAKAAWDAFMAMPQSDYPQISAAWRYYNDGKSWLCKVVQKSKTVCWVSVWDKFFKVSFYFTAKAEDAICNSALAAALKDSFLHPAGKGALRPITIEVRQSSDLAIIRELIGIKLKLK